MQSGRVIQKKYFATISFQYRAGLPVIQVQINNETGWFVFDTGAPNVISEEFKKKLKLKSIGEISSVTDSGGNKVENQNYVKISDINIGGINFINTESIMQNLNSSDVLSCLNIDGIGANLMRKSFWKVNTKQKITLTNDLGNFGITDGLEIIDFTTKIAEPQLLN